jgi:hypothetical protein
VDIGEQERVGALAMLGPEIDPEKFNNGVVHKI